MQLLLKTWTAIKTEKIDWPSIASKSCAAIGIVQAASSRLKVDQNHLHLSLNLFKWLLFSGGKISGFVVVCLSFQQFLMKF